MSDEKQESEQDLRRKLGAKDVDDPVREATPAAAAKPVNPFMAALVTTTVVLVLVGLILYLVAAGQQNTFESVQLALQNAAAQWLTFGGIAFLATMIVGGINWHVSHKDD